MAEWLFQITAPHFCAGGIVVKGVVVEAAPIIKYMRGWQAGRIKFYCLRNQWGLHTERLPEATEAEEAGK